MFNIISNNISLLLNPSLLTEKFSLKDVKVITFDLLKKSAFILSKK